MKKLFIVIISILLILIILLFYYDNSSPHVKYAVRIREQVGQHLSKKYNMLFFADGGGLFQNVNELYLGFQIQGPISKGRLRCILIDCVEKLMEEINMDKDIIPYLENYPFTEKNISITIFVMDDTGKHVNYPSIGRGGAYHGIVEYVTFESDDVRKPYKTVENETYEEAKLLCEHTIQL